MKTKLIILGSGNSMGVPKIDGSWGNCNKNNKKNVRTRCAATGFPESYHHNTPLDKFALDLETFLWTTRRARPPPHKHLRWPSRKCITHILLTFTLIYSYFTHILFIFTNILRIFEDRTNVLQMFVNFTNILLKFYRHLKYY